MISILIFFLTQQFVFADSFIVKEANSEKLVIVGATGFTPPGAIASAPVDENGQPYPIEAIDIADVEDPMTGQIRKVPVLNSGKLAAHKAKVEKEKNDLDAAESTARDKRRARLARLKSIDWSKSKTAAELKDILKDIVENMD